MLHSLRDIKKTNSKKYEGVGETLLRQNFSLQKSEYAFFACHGLGKNPNWSKAARDRASEDLRRCLQANVDVIKAL
jgi:hypothetical protein